MDFDKIVQIAELAGDAILDIYNKSENIKVEHKSDKSPLTEADLAAHNLIVEELKKIDNTPIVSEEGNEGNPLTSDTCWLVDPLDGTKEFIKRNGMFTVNIALMSRKRNRWTPIFGVVHAPVSKTTWFGGTITPSERRGP